MDMPRHLGRVAVLVLAAATAIVTSGCLLVPVPGPVVRRPAVVAPPVVVVPGPPVVVPGPRYYGRGYGYYRGW
jgi:hypothetical protein